MASSSSSELQGQRTSVPDAPHLALNIDNLHKFLVRAKVEGYRENDPPRTPEVRKFSTGQSNPTYLIDGKYVLRKQPPGARSNATAHRLDREYAVLEALQKTDVPAPKPIAFCADAQVLNGQFYLMSFVKGRVLSSPALVGMTPDERRAAYRSVVETLVKLHAVDWRKVGLHDYGQCGNMYARQLNSLLMVSNQQEAVSPKVPKIPYRDEVVRELKRRMPDDDVSLVHGDYKWDNFLLHPTEPRVIAVLDWELSTIGHPMSDLANLCATIYNGPYDPNSISGGGIVGMPDVEKSGIPTQEELLQMYSLLSGRTIDPAQWHFFLTFYFWRGTIISQGIGARLIAGQASSTAGAEFFVKSMPILAELMKFELAELIRLQGPPPREPTLIGKNLKLEDDYTHRSKSEATNYNESVYCNFHSQLGRMGGFLRIGNRPNENFAEVTLCIFSLDTKSTIFHFSRPKIASNNGWECELAGGGRISLRIRRPMEHVTLTFNGRAHRLNKPWLLRDPETLFRKQRHEVSNVETSFQLDFIGCGPVFGGAAGESKESKKGDGGEFAKNHYEQHGRAVGTLNFKEKLPGGETTIQTHVGVDGFGLRDHSWGPRYWQAISSYRWVTANFGAQCGFTFTVIGSSQPLMAMHLGQDQLIVFRKCSIRSRYCDEQNDSLADSQWFEGATRPSNSPNKRHAEFVISAEDVEGKPQMKLTVQGKALGFVPLRNRRAEKITYLGEAFTEYCVQHVSGFDSAILKQGAIGYGMSEFLDQSDDDESGSKL